MGITYQSDVEGIKHDQVAEGFFQGWPNAPSPAVFMKLLRQSYAVEIAVDEGTGKVVGFIQAISDGVLSAYIPLLEVVPSYQGQGIGTQLLERMNKRLGDLYMIDLLCDEELQKFYERKGMRKASGMMIRHYANQAGKGEA